MCGFKDALQAFTHTYAHTHATLACKKEFLGKQTVTHFASADKMLLLELWAGLWPSFSQPCSLPLPPVLLSTGVLNARWGPAGCWQTLRQQRSRAVSCVLVNDLWPGASWAHFLTILPGHDCLIYDLDFPYFASQLICSSGRSLGILETYLLLPEKGSLVYIVGGGCCSGQTSLWVSCTHPPFCLPPPHISLFLLTDIQFISL